MEMLDKFLYSFFGKLDDAIAFVETYVIKMTEWCWHSRDKLMEKIAAAEEKIKVLQQFKL